MNVEQIKLRFWCNEHGYVESGFNKPVERLYFNQYGGIGLPCPLCYKSRPMKIERCVGLVDVNGVDIFEGDALKDNKKNIGVVEFRDGSFGIHLPEDGRRYDRFDFFGYIPNIVSQKRLTVVGNIRENPRILGTAV